HSTSFKRWQGMSMSRKFGRSSLSARSKRVRAFLMYTTWTRALRRGPYRCVVRGRRLFCWQSLGLEPMTEARPALYWPNLRRAQFEEALRHRPVVVVPVGSIEQHGPHCPVDVDLSIPLQIALRASARTEAFPLVVAPEVPFGFTHYNHGFVGTITV